VRGLRAKPLAFPKLGGVHAMIDVVRTAAIASVALRAYQCILCMLHATGTRQGRCKLVHEITLAGWGSIEITRIKRSH
jgi:hypothetical protein